MGKYFKIEQTEEHSDRYNWKAFRANRGNQMSLYVAGLTTLFSMDIGFGSMMGLYFKLEHKTSEKIAIMTYIHKNKKLKS